MSQMIFIKARPLAVIVRRKPPGSKQDHHWEFST